MLIVGKKDERDLMDILGTEVGFINGLVRYGGEPVTLEKYQVAFLQNHSRFRWVTKSRQVGYSFLLTLEAMARCMLREGHNSLFVSYNFEEAKERILLARQIHEDLPLAFQKRLVNDTKSELTFQSNGPRKGLSRIISHPSKAPRGLKGDLALDELAHHLDDEEVYRGSTAVGLRTAGQMTGCSTPLGRRGVFWEIATQEERSYPNYWRQVVPWWLSRFLCTDVPAAAKEAPGLSTEGRVKRFGKPDINMQYQALPLDDFMQEFECVFVDQSYSYYPYDLILPNTHDSLEVATEYSRLVFPEGRLVAGFDVGRVKDASELAIFEEKNGRFVCRLLRKFERTHFSAQEGYLREMLNTLPIARLSIDRGGIGMNLTENLSRDYPQVVGENFTNDTKERWATDFKILLQHRNIDLPKDRNLISQIHGIKRKVLPSGKVSFDADWSAKGGHADRFWAIALACQKEREKPRGRGAIIVARVLG